MGVTLETIDKIAGLEQTAGPTLTFRLDLVTAREIVSARVRAECERAAGSGGIFAPPVVPSEHESMLNARPEKRAKPLPDVERQIEVALGAIESGRVIMLIDGTQITDLDTPLSIKPFGEATFVRLVPLAGG